MSTQTTSTTYTVDYTLRRVYNDADTDMIQTEDVDYCEAKVSTLNEAVARITSEALTAQSATWIDLDAGAGSYYVVATVKRHEDGLWWEVATGEGDPVEWDA